MGRFIFWLRWSARDLRRRWVQVAVIALVIAIGTGAYAGLLSFNSWQSLSLDASYEALNAHDLRVELPESSFVESGTLSGALQAMDNPEWVYASEERLIVSTQVDASGVAAETVLVPGRVVAMEDRGGEPRINDIFLTGGRGLEYGPVLEGHFAAHYDLPPEGTVELAGGIEVRYTGTGFSPEYFIVTTDQGDFMAEANFAVLFMSLPDAQELTGRPGMVNSMVITLKAGVDRQAAAGEVGRALMASLTGLGTTITTIEQDDAFVMLYEDAEADRAMFNVLAFLVLIAAAFAAFNLISRMVEAQRREIGVGMALGLRPGLIALRPLLVGAQIAALGVIFGVGMGLLIAYLMRSVFEDILPLPVWVTPLQAGTFLIGAAIGFLVPFLAIAWPVKRAVRVDPVQAIRTGHLASRGGGLAPLLKRLPLPGRSFGHMPFRNLLRAPRRTMLTVLGVGASLVVMVAILGTVDSLQDVVDRGSQEVDRGAPDRLDVTLQGFEPLDSEVVRAIAASPAVGEIEPTLVVSAQALAEREDIGVQLQVLDLESDIWHPTVIEAADRGGLPGIILASKAADDVAARPGDTVTLRHPFLDPEGTIDIRETEMRLIGVHPNPLRFLAYMDVSDAGSLGLAGLTNDLQVTAASGTSVDELKRALFGMPGVAVIVEPGATLQLTSDLLSEFSSIFQVFAAFALFLALLIAFNVASINADERAREHATMAAYGVRVRTMLRMSMVEVGLIGLMGTIIGVGLGALAARGLLAVNESAIPELEMVLHISWGTIVATIGLGIVVVGLAPLFTARKLRRMNIPSTLRVME